MSTLDRERRDGRAPSLYATRALAYQVPLRADAGRCPARARSTEQAWAPGRRRPRLPRPGRRVPRRLGAPAPLQGRPGGGGAPRAPLPRLRHTFGSLAINAASIVDVLHWLGHADIETTMRYLHRKSRAGEARQLAPAFEVASVVQANLQANALHTPAGAIRGDAAEEAEVPAQQGVSVERYGIPAEI